MIDKNNAFDHKWLYTVTMDIMKLEVSLSETVQATTYATNISHERHENLTQKRGQEERDTLVSNWVNHKISN